MIPNLAGKIARDTATERTGPTLEHNAITTNCMDITQIPSGIEGHHVKHEKPRDFKFLSYYTIYEKGLNGFA